MSLQNDTENYTLVTGASTGIGRAIVEKLIQEKYHVFACARKKADLESLKALSPLVIPVELDVTKPEQQRLAFDQVQSQLPAGANFNLVNNAGIVAPGAIENISLEDLRYQFEVNVIGVVSTTQTFLPLLKKSKGRIVMISSISGIVSTPFLGAYSASKFALEAICDSLRVELSTCGVGVYIIQPGPIATPIWEKNFALEEQIRKKLSVEQEKVYGASIDKFKRTVQKGIETAIPAETVAMAVFESLAKKNPPLRKIVAASPVRTSIGLARFLPTALLDQGIKKSYMAD